MKITRVGTLASEKATENFTGTVRRDRLVNADAPGRVLTGLVSFEPCARTDWHTHPLGQILIVTCGCGWVQAWGGPKYTIRSGDVVWTAAEEKHWHGATSTTAMSHIAVTESLNGKAAEWMEKVSDSQYMCVAVNE